MKKILIVGGSGFIGQHLIKRLIKEGYYITTLIPSKNKISTSTFIKKVKIIEGSITDQKLVESLIKGQNFVINLASLTDKIRAEGTIKKEEIKDIGKKSLEINCIGELNILQSIVNINPKCHHIFMGSRSQFGKIKKEGQLIKEDQEQKPFSFYGIHKKVCEDYINYYKQLYNINSMILRTVGVYGIPLSGEKTKNIISHFVKASLNNEDLIINGDGTYIKDFIYIDDLIDLILIGVKKKIAGTYNIGSGKGYSMREIAYKIKDICKSKSKIKYRKLNHEEELFELDGCIMDIKKVEKETMWKPKITLDKGIKNTELFYRKEAYKI